MMGHSRFFLLLLLSSLLFLSFGHGFGRVALMETEHAHSTPGIVDHARKMRIMLEIMDYEETKPNTNPGNGHVFSPYSPIPSPLPRD